MEWTEPNLLVKMATQRQSDASIPKGSAGNNRGKKVKWSTYGLYPSKYHYAHSGYADFLLTENNF